MDDPVCCPVCTLFLREGVTLHSHLQTHPKEQVIDALIRLNHNGTNGTTVVVDRNDRLEQNPTNETTLRSTEDSSKLSEEYTNNENSSVAYHPFVQSIDIPVIPQYISVPVAATPNSEREHTQPSIMQMVYNPSMYNVIQHVPSQGSEMMNLALHQHYLRQFIPSPAFIDTSNPFVGQHPAIHYAAFAPPLTSNMAICQPFQAQAIPVSPTISQEQYSPSNSLKEPTLHENRSVADSNLLGGNELPVKNCKLSEKNICLENSYENLDISVQCDISTDVDQSKEVTYSGSFNNYKTECSISENVTECSISENVTDCCELSHLNVSLDKSKSNELSSKSQEGFTSASNGSDSVLIKNGPETTLNNYSEIVSENSSDVTESLFESSNKCDSEVLNRNDIEISNKTVPDVFNTSVDVDSNDISILSISEVIIDIEDFQSDSHNADSNEIQDPASNKDNYSFISNKNDFECTSEKNALDIVSSELPDCTVISQGGSEDCKTDQVEYINETDEISKGIVQHDDAVEAKEKVHKEKPIVEVTKTHSNALDTISDSVMEPEPLTCTEVHELAINLVTPDSVFNTAETLNKCVAVTTAESIEKMPENNVDIHVESAIIEFDGLQYLVPLLENSGSYVQYASNSENNTEVVVTDIPSSTSYILEDLSGAPVNLQVPYEHQQIEECIAQCEVVPSEQQDLSKEEENGSTSYDLLARESWEASDGSDIEISIPSFAQLKNENEPCNETDAAAAKQLSPHAKTPPGKGKKKVKTPRSYVCWTCGIAFNCPKERRVHQSMHHVSQSSAEDGELVKRKLSGDSEIIDITKDTVNERKVGNNDSIEKKFNSKKFGKVYAVKKIKIKNLNSEEKKPLNETFRPREQIESEPIPFEKVFVQSLNSVVVEESLDATEKCDVAVKSNEKPVDRKVEEASIITPSVLVKSFCNKCHEVFETQKELYDHMHEFHKVPKETKLTCPRCKMWFPNEKHLNEHFKIHPLECTRCGKLFYRKQNLNLHLKRHLGIKPFICAICDKSFITKQKLTEHNNTHTGDSPIKCNLCSHSFRRYSNLVQHKNRHHLKLKKKVKDFLCHCGEVFHSRKKLAWHMEIHEEKPKSCSFCSERFIHEASLTRHIRKAHDQKYVPKGSKGSENAECPTCGFTYLKSSLAVHMRTHTGIRPFQCGRCGKDFSTKWNLHLHEWTHANRNSKPYKCMLCKCAFYRESDYQSHLHSHRNVKPYTCNYCGCQFIRKNNCVRHMREHETSKSFSCNICGKTFHRNYYLKDHLRVHNGIRPFACHICGKASSTKSNHNKHVKIHHAREPVNTEG